MRLRYLEIINAVLQTGSIGDAARLLGIGVPASVEAGLVQCEAELGIPLFVRQDGKLEPTPEALALLPDIREVFRQVERVSDRAAAFAQGRRSGLTVGGGLALCNGYLVEAAARFRRQHPDVDLVLHSLRTTDLVQRVMSREIDLGVCYGPVANSALSVEVMVSRDLVCVLPEAHPLAARARLTPADLVGEALITYVVGDRLRAKVDALFRDTEQKPAFGIQVSQTITAIRLVEAGGGIALVEPFFFDALRPRGLVSRVMSPSESLTVEAVSLASGTAQPVLLSAFLAILRDVTRGA